MKRFTALLLPMAALVLFAFLVLTPQEQANAFTSEDSFSHTSNLDTASFSLPPQYICKDTVIQTPQGCLRIGCQRIDCEDCCLVWKDKNGNGTIQRDEVRCRCKGNPQNPDLCKFRRQPVDCP